MPQTKAALYAHEGCILLRTVLGKFVCTSATLASGIPLGRKGPSVQVGAGIASVLGRFLGLTSEKAKALLPVGAAALAADQHGLVGVINRSRLERELAESADKRLAALVAMLVFPHVHSDEGLELALDRMGANQIEVLPVVSRADVHELQGVVTLHDVLDSYGVSRLDQTWAYRLSEAQHR